MDRLDRDAGSTVGPQQASLGAQRDAGRSLPRVDAVRTLAPVDGAQGIDDPDEESSIVRVQRVRAHLAGQAAPPAVGADSPTRVVRDVGLYLLAFAAGAGLGVAAILAVAGRVAVATPDDVGATDLVAAAHAQLDAEPEAAAAAFRAALADDPSDVAAQSGLGQAMILLGDRYEAELWLCRAASSSGSHADAARVAVRTHGILCR